MKRTTPLVCCCGAKRAGGEGWRCMQTETDRVPSLPAFAQRDHRPLCRSERTVRKLSKLHLPCVRLTDKHCKAVRLRGPEPHIIYCPGTPPHPHRLFLSPRLYRANIHTYLHNQPFSVYQKKKKEIHLYLQQLNRG